MAGNVACMELVKKSYFFTWQRLIGGPVRWQEGGKVVVLLPHMAFLHWRIRVRRWLLHVRYWLLGQAIMIELSEIASINVTVWGDGAWLKTDHPSTITNPWPQGNEARERWSCPSRPWSRSIWQNRNTSLPDAPNFSEPAIQGRRNFTGRTVHKPKEHLWRSRRN